MSQSSPEFCPSWYCRGPHVQTCLPALFRRVVMPFPARRVSLELPDGDRLLLDWYRRERESEKLAIIAHGLEGDSRRYYVLGMVRALLAAGWDCLAWNFRGCGGELNRLPKFTHSGSWDDVSAVVEHAMAEARPRHLALLGFSMGGNLHLNYLCRTSIPETVCAAVNFSVPIDLPGCVSALTARRNWLYMHRFMIFMRRRVRAMALLHPDTISADSLQHVRTFADFDTRYTAPMHGFRSEAEYWETCSSKPWLEKISVPTLIVNAADDPFLGKTCYPPLHLSEQQTNVTFEVTDHGGHCGFFEHGPNESLYWSERRAVDFLQDRI